MILEESELDIKTKVCATIASPWVVHLVSRHVPVEMAEDKMPLNYGKELVFHGCGTIIECEEDYQVDEGPLYVTTIITAASLFVRTNGVPPSQIQVDVYLSDAELHQGHVFACDFHYNLAEVRIFTFSPLQTATVRPLDDVLSIRPTAPQLQLLQETPSQLCPVDSNSFRIIPGTKIITLLCSSHPHRTCIFPGVFGTTALDSGLDCNELYWVKGTEQFNCSTGAVINYHGEVIGISFYNSPFLPINIVSRWWKHFKSCGEYRRPWPGMEVANLHSLHFEILIDFMTMFPSTSTGVVVTKSSIFPSLSSSQYKVSGKRKRGGGGGGGGGGGDELLVAYDMDVSTKVATAIASLSVVTLVSRHVPDEMAVLESESETYEYTKLPGEDIVFWGSGTIIDCEVANHKYVTTIITAASRFERTNGLQPHQLKVDVYLSDGQLCKGQVLACDFHYNLAAVIIKTNSSLKTATFRSLNDVISIELSHCLQLPDHIIHPRSNLFKVLPDTKITSLWRSYKSSRGLSVSAGVFGFTSPSTDLDCNELYSVNGIEQTECCGGPVINCREVIGITCYNSHFLPANIVSRWWKHFKSCGEYRRPWLGVEVINLHSSHLEFLEVFMMKSPYISTSVVVTKVVQDSPASCSGIRPNDVIVECNGKLVCSKLEFLDMLWDMVGEDIEVNVLRVTDGEKVKLNLTVGETTPNKFYKWRRTDWIAMNKEMKQTLRRLRLNN